MMVLRWQKNILMKSRNGQTHERGKNNENVHHQEKNEWDRARRDCEGFVLVEN